MKIHLYADYRGVLTGEVFYAAGEHDLAEGTAVALVAAGRAEYVDEPEPEPTPAPTKTTKRNTKK